QNDLHKKLWSSDGTPNGTVEVASLNSTLSELSNNVNTILTVGFARSLSLDPFLFATTLANSTQIWISDGVSQLGTQQLAALSHPTQTPGPGYALPGDQFFDTEAAVFFMGWIGEGTAALWRSDRTPTGTLKLQALNSDTSSFVPWQQHLYFTAEQPETGWEWWASDGSPEGTVLLKDIQPGKEGSRSHLLSGLGSTFFALAESPDGLALWSTTGTPESTQMIKQLSPESFYAQAHDTQSIVHEGRLFFATLVTREEPQANGTTLSKIIYELWVTDGTTEGTQQLGTMGEAVRELTAFKGRLFFNGGGPNGQELWATDGTPEGTQQVIDLSPGGKTVSPPCPPPLVAPPSPFCSPYIDPNNSNPRELIAHGDFLYFLANQFDLFRTDGTGQGMQYVKRLEGRDREWPSVAQLGDTLLFTGYEDNQSVHPQLWALPTLSSD
ncbi:MAG: hypothetical protein WBC73_22005, partial [Phormidesmis sp.]